MHGKEKYSSFALSIDLKIQEAKIIFHKIVSLFIRNMRALDYVTKKKSKQWETSVRIPENLLLMRVKRHFSPLSIAFSRQRVLDENTLKDTPRMRSFQIKREKISAQEVTVINCDTSEVDPPLKKRIRVERLNRLGSITTESMM